MPIYIPGKEGKRMGALLKYTNIVELSGDIAKLKILTDQRRSDTLQPRLDDLAIIHEKSGKKRLAQVIDLNEDTVTLQIYEGTKGISVDSEVSFLGRAMQVSYSPNILGRIFNGGGNPIDNGPALEDEKKIDINTPSVNPVKRTVPSKMIRTNVPMIDVFNCLVESQKIPIFSVSGEPYNKLLAQIATEADADVVIFGGMGLIFDDYYNFKKHFEDAGVFNRTIMFVNQGSDPIVERLAVPDMALACAEKMATEEGKRVLVLLTDMTSFADALKEIGISMEKIPSNRGYIGDLYSQLARRYEKACAYQGAGSVTILAVTTMPGNDVTHPIPDNTGYITEGQFYLYDQVLDPFGSLSRLKQHVIGKETREDHGAVANEMIRFYSEAKDAEQKQSMAFELSDYDERLIKFGGLFKQRFMELNSIMPLEDALDLCWKTMFQCFKRGELLIKEDILKKYGDRYE